MTNVRTQLRGTLVPAVTWDLNCHLANINYKYHYKYVSYRSYFTKNGALEKNSTDGGTNLVSEEMCNFFKHWGVKMCISLAHFPQSKGRAEAAIKSARRLLRDNTGPRGTLDTDKLSVALLQYLNIPLREIYRSPAQLAGRPLKNGVAAPKQHYKVDMN